MTPLARSIFLNTCDGVDGLPQSFRDAIPACQFFEVSAVADMVSKMAWDIAYGITPFSSEGLFLPAEPCVIEWRTGDDSGQREGFLLTRRGARIWGAWYFGYPKGWVSEAIFEDLFGEMKAGPLIHPMKLWSIPGDDVDGAPSHDRYDAWNVAKIALFISLINTPRIFGRRQHMPTAKVERELLRRRLPQGRFPLGAWSEILLKVTPPQDMSDLPSAEAHLTGMKAMHFCRAHLRVRLGRVELVRGHWRGDPSLGTKRSRYVLNA